MRLGLVMMLLLMAGCSTPPATTPDTPVDTTEPTLPDAIVLDAVIGLGNPLLADGHCPFTGECIVHPFTLRAPATMQIDIDVQAGEMHWGLYQGGEQRGSRQVSGPWQAERHLAPGDYEIYLQNYGAVDVRVTGTVSWYHAFNGTGTVSAEDFSDQGTWAAGRHDYVFYDACDGCDEYPFTVAGEGYGTVKASIRLTWGGPPDMAALKLRLGEDTLAQEPLNLVSDSREMYVDLFPGDYVLQVGATAPEEQDWTLTATFS